MDVITIIKNEENEENEEETVEAVETIKVEGQDVQTVVLQNLDEYQNEDEEVPVMLNQYDDSDGTIQMAQIAEMDEGYTYIIEGGPNFADENQTYIIRAETGEHYIIEEYQEVYEESQDSQYETYEIEEGTTLTIHEEEVEEHQVHEEPEEEEDEEEEHEEAILPDSPEEERIAEYEQEEELADDPDYSPTERVYVNDVLQESIGIKQERQPYYLETTTEEEERVDEPEEMEEEEEEEQRLPEEEEEQLERSQKEMIKVKVEVADSEDENIECDRCEKKFKTSKGLKRHITVAHNEDYAPEDPLTFQICACCGEPKDSAHTIGDIQCPDCPDLFVSQNSLDRHVSIEHNKTGDYSCVECDKKFDGREPLLEHMRVHPLKSVKCDECHREFSRKYHLDRHIAQTGCTGYPRAAYECRVCKKFFTRKDNLAEHLRTHAGITKKKKGYVCEFCRKEFHGAALLNIHVRTHTGERPYSCDLCPKSFPSSGAMKKHRRMHTGEKPYQCEDCGKRFAAKETLNRHVKTHTGVKPHVCKFCGKSFIQAAQLRAHVFHHTGENAYTCPICSRAFNRRLRLTTHIKFMHEGEQPLNCVHPGCTKTFFRREDMRRHLVIHTGEKPFECEVCHKRFTVKSSLRMHAFTHRKEPPVSCETCGRAFIRQDCLMRHVRARHRDVLEDVMVSAEKKRLQKQLLTAAGDPGLSGSLRENAVWNELTLTESVKELLGLLVDEDCLAEFGHPEAPVDKVLDAVICRCGHAPAAAGLDYITRMRENAKLLFTVVIDDASVKQLLRDQTVEEVIAHVLRLARRQRAQ